MQDESEALASPRAQGSSGRLLTAEEITQQHEQVCDLAREREGGGMGREGGQKTEGGHRKPRDCLISGC